MDASASASAPKPTKGLKKLWAKVKASMRSDSSRSQVRTDQVVQPSREREEPHAVTAPAPVSTRSLAISEQPTKPKVSQNMEDEGVAEPAKSVTAAIEVDEGEDSADAYGDTSRASIDIADLHRYHPRISTTRRSIPSEKQKFDQAQAVYEKYGIVLNISDWRHPEQSAVDRVEKKTRMRVRYTCHQCSSVFGRDKVCSTCSHNRTGCEQCSRYPVKRVGEKVKREKPAVRELPVQHVTTGACHECKTEFPIGTVTCETCKHTICERCLHETVLASPLTAPRIASRPPVILAT